MFADYSTRSGEWPAVIVYCLAQRASVLLQRNLKYFHGTTVNRAVVLDIREAILTFQGLYVMNLEKLQNEETCVWGEACFR